MKQCSKCNLYKDESDFSRKTKTKLQNYCKLCQNIISKNHYKNNKQKYLDRNKRFKQKNQLYIYNYLLNHPCIDCGESDPLVLEFDHINGKNFNFGKSYYCYSLSKIKKEIKLTEIRCANCHRIKHINAVPGYKNIAK